jgi:hypothetical protein
MPEPHATDQEDTAEFLQIVFNLARTATMIVLKMQIIVSLSSRNSSRG